MPPENLDTIDFEQRAEALYGYIDSLVIRYMVVQSNCLETPWGALTHQEEKVVKILGQQGACIMREVAEPLGFALSTATGIVDKLVRKKLVYRERPETDRRIVRIGLTEAGRETYRGLKEKFMELCRGMLGGLSDAEQRQLLALIRKTIRST